MKRGGDEFVIKECIITVNAWEQFLDRGFNEPYTRREVRELFNGKSVRLMADGSSYYIMVLGDTRYVFCTRGRCDPSFGKFVLVGVREHRTDHTTQKQKDWPIGNTGQPELRKREHKPE